MFSRTVVQRRTIERFRLLNVSVLSLFGVVVALTTQGPVALRAVVSVLLLVGVGLLWRFRNHEANPILRAAMLTGLAWAVFLDSDVGAYLLLCALFSGLLLSRLVRYRDGTISLTAS